MSANVAFLTRLARIAGESACDETRAARAAALVHAYEAVLYAGLGFAQARRPTAHAKEIATETFEALRRELLKGEIGAPPAAARMLAAVRERIEMARRALALRITADGDAGAASGEGRRPKDSTDAEDAPSPASSRYQDRQRLDALRAGLRDRRAVTTSWRAIAQSRNLLISS